MNTQKYNYNSMLARLTLSCPLLRLLVELPAVPVVCPGGSSNVPSVREQKIFSSFSQELVASR